MDENIFWHNETLLKNTAEALEENNFKVITAENASAALREIVKLIDKSETVAFGGSQTVKQLGIINELQKRAQNLFQQKPGMSREEVIELRRKALGSDVFIASPNAVTLEGSLFFVDKIGNRAAGVMFGPKKVIVIAGINKIVENEIAALNRIKTKAGPVNSKRLGLKNPCVKTGLCSDCASKDRICNIYLTLRKKPSNTDYFVVLVSENLGY